MEISYSVQTVILSSSEAQDALWNILDHAEAPLLLYLKQKRHKPNIKTIWNSPSFFNPMYNMEKNSFPDFWTPCTVRLAALHKRRSFCTSAALHQRENLDWVSRETERTTEKKTTSHRQRNGQCLHRNMSNMPNKEKQHSINTNVVICGAVCRESLRL